MHDPTLWAGGQKLTFFWAYLHQFSSACGKLGRKQIGFAEADLFARALRSSKQKLTELCPKMWKLFAQFVGGFQKYSMVLEIVPPCPRFVTTGFVTTAEYYCNGRSCLPYMHTLHDTFGPPAKVS